jgi:hypothetical protein
MYLESFYSKNPLMPITDGKDMDEIPETAGGAKTSLYAIVRKPAS